MKALLDLAVPLVTFVILLTVGFDLTLDDFRRVRRQPRVVATGLLAPPLLLPLLAWGLVVLVGPPPAVTAGLLMIAACPIGGISNVYSHLAGASPALSVVLTGASSLVAVASIPLADRMFRALLGSSLGLSAPVPLIVGQLLLMLALPVGLGMWVRARWPASATRGHAWLGRAGFSGVGALIVMIIASNPHAVADGLAITVPLSAMFIAVSFGVGWLVATAINATRPDRFTLATEFATRNVAVATAVAVTLAGHLEFAFFATTYFLTELPMMIVAIWAFRRSGSPPSR